MRILHVITGLGTGGAEMMLFKLLQETQDTAALQYVASLTDEGTLGPRIRNLGLDVLSLGMRRGSVSVTGVRKFLQLTRTFRPDVVVSWMYHANMFALATRRPWGAPPVIWNIRHSLHDLGRDRLLTRAIIRGGALVSALPARIVYNSAKSLAQHVAIGYRSKSALVIPNGFNTDDFQPSLPDRVLWRKRLNLDDTTPTMGLIARYHPTKNHSLFLRAAALVAERIPNMVAVMAGTSVDEQNQPLMAEIRSRGLLGRVRLLGEVRNTAPLLNALDVACLSSWGESFPNVLGEALLCGRPCVTTDVGDAAALVGNEGAVVPVDRPDLFADAVCRFLGMAEQERIELGRSARERISRLYGIKAVSRMYGELYKSVLDLHASP